MKADLIDTDYVYNHRFYNIWKTIVLAYGVLLILATGYNGIESLSKYNTIITMTSTCIVAYYFIITLANNFLFSRIGQLTIKDEVLKISVDDQITTLDLITIDEIEFGKHDGKFYTVVVKQNTITVELNTTQLLEFKKTLELYNVKIKHHHFSDKLSHWFSKNISRFSTKNY